MAATDHIFALIDCNNFYASCERIFNPALEKKPVVVLSNNDGCIISRSNEAKALGIPMGAPLFEMQALIKKQEVKVLSSNYALYGDMSQRVMATLMEFSPDIEIYSIDEAFLSLNGFEHKNLTDYAKTIRATVKQRTGIPVSIGIGATKTLAKVANKTAKKNSALQSVFDLVNYPSVDEVLEKMQVENVWGIGRSLSKMLNRHGVLNALQLKNLPDTWIRKNMTVVGHRLVWELRGISCLPLDMVVPPKKGIMCSRSFGKPVTKLDGLKEALSTYTTRAAEKLRAQNSLAGLIMVYITTNPFNDMPYYSNAVTFSLPFPSANTAVLIRHAHQIMEKIYKDGYAYKKTGVFLSGIVPDNQMQRDMFVKEPDLVREKKLLRAVDAINYQFGSDTIQYASSGMIKPWRMKQAYRSPRFTTRWDEILTVKI
ncbi:Y-family DNA polymerase [bacterium]|nr:MAG: Y-family DNA polymerase [bacterium]